MTFIIERDSAEVGKPGRVFVTGPHFGRSVYSSTLLQDEASRYSEDEARRLVATKWRHLRPEVAEAP